MNAQPPFVLIVWRAVVPRPNVVLSVVFLCVVDLLRVHFAEGVDHVTDLVSVDVDTDDAVEVAASQTACLSVSCSMSVVMVDPFRFSSHGRHPRPLAVRGFGGDRGD